MTIHTEVEHTFFEVIEDLDFDPRKLSEFSHETFMQKMYHSDWGEILETLAWAWACGNEDVAAQCTERFNQLHAKFSAPPAKRNNAAKKATARKQTASEKLETES